MKEDFFRDKTIFYQTRKELYSQIEVCIKDNSLREKLMVKELSLIGCKRLNIKAGGSMDKWLMGLSKTSIMRFKAISTRI